MGYLRLVSSTHYPFSHSSMKPLIYCFRSSEFLKACKKLMARPGLKPQLNLMFLFNEHIEVIVFDRAHISKQNRTHKTFIRLWNAIKRLIFLLTKQIIDASYKLLILLFATITLLSVVRLKF